MGGEEAKSSRAKSRDRGRAEVEKRRRAESSRSTTSAKSRELDEKRVSGVWVRMMKDREGEGVGIERNEK